MQERAGADVHTVADLVHRAAVRDPDHLALVYEGSRLSWAELDERVDRAAAALRGLGLDPGDRVLLQLGNTPDFPVLYAGALRAGLVAVPANTGYTGPELAHLLADSGARVLATSSVQVISAAGGLRADAPALEHVVVAAPSGPDGTVPLPGLLAGATPDPGARHRPASGEELAVLLYTSGTSGRPRGAMLSHRALLANLEQCGAIRPTVATPADVLLLAIPLFHAYGLNPGFGMLAWAGATGVLVDSFDPAGSLELMARHRVTNVPAVPAMYVQWVDQPGLAAGFASVRLALSGAAPLPPPVLARLAAAGVTVWEGYGLTETAPVLTSTLIGGVPKPGSVGRALPGVELRLAGAEDADDDDPDDDGDPGEIQVRGPNLFSGYWPDGAEGPDDSGWWSTGDVAYADDDGDLHLVDRRKELILVSGFNVYPAEVEAVLVGHPDVLEAAVLGRPDPERGDETVLAYVVPRADAGLTEAGLLEWAAGSLARFKLPAAVVFVPELPYSATGKVSKARLRASSAD
ncbi:MAG TPA: AMP-binding protein [Mycobacteriales bacterium]|jgi:long-chain acyl-CoA synthetase|nr:AMP-binding protein [Mycobacteriales bacterium]